GPYVLAARVAHRERGEEGVAIRRADRRPAHDLRLPRDVGSGLHPYLVPGPAAGRENGPRLRAGRAVGLEHVPRAAGDALEQGAVDVAARVREIEPEDRA